MPEVMVAAAGIWVFVSILVLAMCRAAKVGDDVHFLVQGTLYTFIQPAVDSHVATAAASHARARIMGLYSAFGLAGGFAGANGFSFLYAWNFRYSLFALGIGYGICVLIGGLLIRWAEKKYHWLYTPENG